MGLFNDVWEQTKAEQEEKQKRKKIERLAKAYKLSFEEAALQYEENNKKVRELLKKGLCEGIYRFKSICYMANRGFIFWVLRGIMNPSIMTAALPRGRVH